MECSPLQRASQAVLQVSDLRVLLQGRHSKRLSLLGMPLKLEHSAQTQSPGTATAGNPLRNDGRGATLDAGGLGRQAAARLFSQTS